MMKRVAEIIFIVLLVFAGLIFLSSVYFALRGDDETALPLPGYKGGVGLVEVKGVILDSEATVKTITDFIENDAVKALVVRINSPGGGVAASQEIYDALRRARKAGIPVVASMAGVAASGGYYIACAADSIVANPGTTTGSIGVIMRLLDYSGLLKKVGLRYNTIKSGRFKDIGDGSRPLRPEEQAYLQEFLDDAYVQFVDVVAQSRKMERTQVLQIADGRIYTGQQALELGLIDRLGTLEDAIELAAAMADLSGKPRLIRPKKRKIGLTDLLFGDVQDVLQMLQTLPIVRYQLDL